MDDKVKRLHDWLLETSPEYRAFTEDAPRREIERILLDLDADDQPADRERDDEGSAFEW